LQEWQSQLHGILRDGIEAGTIRAGIDLQFTANRIIGSLEGAMLISRIERNDHSLHQSLQQLSAWIDSELRQNIA
jgi:hypothetical protein